MHAPLRLLILACALALAACAAIPVFSPVATYVVVRHAEKVDDGSRDPSLTDAGRARAHALAGLLRSRDVVAVYATDFRRTRDTAEPTAAVHDLSIISYDAEAPAEAVAERLRRRSEEHTSELQSLMRISYAVFCLKKKKQHNSHN